MVIGLGKKQIFGTVLVAIILLTCCYGVLLGWTTTSATKIPSAGTIGPRVNPEWYGTGWGWWDKSFDDPISQWATLIPPYESWKFNTVRLGFVFPDAPYCEDWATLPLDYEKLDQLLDYLYSNGLLAILDCHNSENSSSYFGGPEWMDGWVNLVARFKNDRRIAAWELANEPSRKYGKWHPSITTYYEFLQAFANCVDAIRALGDTHPVIYPAPYYWGLEFPQELRRPNTIISFHSWNYKYTVEETLEKAQNIRSQWQYWMGQGFPVWLGETGVHPETGKYETPWDVEVERFLYVINACIEDGVGFSFWRYGYKFGNTAEINRLLLTSDYSKLV